ncbi:hypothetical protein D3C72_1795480 [compost metagenome]
MPINRQLKPDRNSTNRPDSATRIDVPRSGCAATSRVGRKISTSAMAVFFSEGGQTSRLIKRATISGTAIFAISEGWKRTIPRSSQRCAPFEIAPNASTAISKIIQIK